MHVEVGIKSGFQDYAIVLYFILDGDLLLRWSVGFLGLLVGAG